MGSGSRYSRESNEFCGHRAGGRSFEQPAVVVREVYNPLRRGGTISGLPLPTLPMKGRVPAGELGEIEQNPLSGTSPCHQRLALAPERKAGGRMRGGSPQLLRSSD